MGVDLYPSIIHEGDLSPDAVGSEIDDICTEIYEACKGFGTDEDRLLKAIGSLSPETRCKVALRYPQMYDRELKEKLKSECGSKDFGTALQFLAVSPDVAECDMISKACKGLGTKELLLGSIICGRSNKEMEILKKKFFDVTGGDLGKLLDSELGGNLEALIFNCLQAAEEEYDPDFHTADKINEDVSKLYEMGQGKFGTDEKGFFKLLVASPPEYLKKVNLVYAEAHGFTLLKAVETELGGASRESGLFMLKMKLKPYEAVAELIKEACAGFGTNELLLTCILIRYQKILKEVMSAHEALYGKTVEERVQSEVGGDYAKLLVEILSAAE